ncbi:hypothetical protein JCM11641_005712 [Rhodosporidiobolus odoratus]
MHFSLTVLATLFTLVTPGFSAPAVSLVERADVVDNGVACKGAFQCRTVKRPMNSAALCKANVCSYTCLAGYLDLGKRCVKLASTTSTTIAATSSSSSTSSSAPIWTPGTTTTTTTSVIPTATLTPNAVKAAGVTAFTGTNDNAIISWFHTASSTDSTNGHSWCGYPYSDAVPGFAPSLATMLANFNGSYTDAATAFCGLEAIVTSPNGLTTTLYIADAFDDTWVRTPASIDVVYGSFPLLFGSVTNNKNDVVKQGSWTLTGRRNERYKFKGLGATGLPV